MANIMIVDDAAFMRMVVRNHVEKNGHTVVGEASNGLRAIEEYDKCNPDLVLMDITMPDMDGIEAVRQITKKHPDAKIIMCSAMGQETMVKDAIKAGAKDFMVKPITEQIISERLKKYFK